MFKKERESNFELLRMVAMFSIVFYHLLGVYWHDNDAQTHIMFDALTVPFHFGVPVFVLISGYFGIRALWRGVLKLLVPVFLYYVPIELVHTYQTNEGGNYLCAVMFLSQTPYWFIQTYLWLFMVSPAINLYINNIHSLRQRLMIISLLAFVTMYVGTVGNDNSLTGGKNVLYFSLLYIIGRTLYEYRENWKQISAKILIPLYLFINIGLVFTYFIVRSIPIELFYPYNSIGMLFNSILIFMIFGKIKVKSRIINYIAASTFSIYILHGQPALFDLQMNTVKYLYHQIGYGISFFIVLALFSLFVMILSIVIDKCCAPIYNRFIERGISNFNKK